MIDFLLNGQRQRCEVPPDFSVLELLRGTLGLTGTKEGCASGDCGACTVAIGAAGPDDGVHFHSANACITPAHQLHGRHLVTVEGLANGDRLHPAQAAMVACHASQCGFCTPGIVMSLFTLHEARRHAPAPLTPSQLEAALGGNLCRCTGYRPIRDAALSLDAHPATRPEWLDRLPAASPRTADAAFAQPETLAALIALRRRHPEARLVAGATDLWLETTQQLGRFPRLIDVTRVAELTAITEATLDDGRHGWWIGAAVPFDRLAPLLAAQWPGFAQLLHRLGSAQIRHRGTLGGNVANASPVGDTPPVLLALESRLRLAGPDGERELPLEAFFLDYRRTALAEGESIVALFLPRAETQRRLVAWKLSKRREDDIAALLGAFHWIRDGEVLREVRLAFGGMAATPRRAYAAETALEGQAPTPAAFEAARQALGQEFQPLSDVRGSAGYRRLAAANLLERLRRVIEQEANGTGEELMLHAYAH